MTPRVYVAERGEQIKVGCSRNPVQRTRALQAALVASIPGDFGLEAEIHRLLAPYRVHGEWYRRCDAVDAVVVRIIDLEGEERARLLASFEARLGADA